MKSKFSFEHNLRLLISRYSAALFLGFIYNYVCLQCLDSIILLLRVELTISNILLSGNFLHQVITLLIFRERIFGGRDFLNRRTILWRYLSHFRRQIISICVKINLVKLLQLYLRIFDPSRFIDSFYF